MDCHDIQQKMEAFHDGELPPDQVKIISDHLESCPVCLAEWERLRKVDDLVAETEGLDPGPEAWQRMRVKIQQGIASKRVIERPQIWEWIKWLLSPQYAVVKVGAVLAVVVLTFVVSRQLTIQRITPPSRTIFESAVPSSLSEGIKQEIPALQSSTVIESLQVALTHPKPVSDVDKGQRLSQSSKKEKEITRSAIPKPSLGGEETTQPLLQLQAEQVPPETKKVVTNVGDTLQTLQGVHVDSEGEFHFRGGKSREVQTTVDGLSAQKDEEKATAETPSVLTGGFNQELSRSKPQLDKTTESHTTLTMQVSEETQDTDSLLIFPFSPISYWETYRISLDSTSKFATESKNLWMEYHRCENQPCQQLVIPYLVDVLFRESMQYHETDNITETMQLMKQHKGLLKEAWGKQRYNVRWEKMQELSKR